MRLLRLLPILSPVLCLTPFTMHADSITTFTLSGAYAPRNAGTLAEKPVSGTITIDTTTGVVDAVNLNQPQSNRPYESTYVGYASPAFPIIEIYEDWGRLEPDSVNLYIPVSTLVGYNGGSVCSLDYSCIYGAKSSAGDIEDHDFLYGDLSPSAAPEPSSLTLLGVGALAMLSLAGNKGRSLLRR